MHTTIKQICNSSDCHKLIATHWNCSLQGPSGPRAQGHLSTLPGLALCVGVFCTVKSNNIVLHEMYHYSIFLSFDHGQNLRAISEIALFAMKPDFKIGQDSNTLSPALWKICLLPVICLLFSYLLPDNTCSNNSNVLYFMMFKTEKQAQVIKYKQKNIWYCNLMI